MICIPITASTTWGALKDIEASKDADLLELRLDFIKDISEKNLERLLKNKKKKIIVTDRKKRLKLIKKAIKLKADFVDVDISLPPKIIRSTIKNKKKTKIIVSFHNFKKTNEKEINNKFEKIKKLRPDIIKIVTFANKITDNLIIFDLIRKAKKQKKNIIALCMGEKGEISRILSLVLGAELTFGSLRKGKESAPGQITAELLKKVYRINKLKNKNPKIFGLVGNPVKHSKGILIHNKTFDKLKLNNIYVNFLVDDLKPFIKNFGYLISGLSITLPHKKEIVKYLHKIEPISKKIGAVNTIIKRNKKLIGYNTDVKGAIDAIKDKTKIKNKNVLLIGAGGAAKAIAFGIKKQKGKLIIANRTLAKGKKLAKELHCRYCSLNKINKLRNIDILINSTSIGMFPSIKKTPIKKNILKKIIKRKGVVFDAVYNPVKTRLLRDAAALKLKTISGINMFNKQAALQFKIFTGKRLK